MVVPTYPEGGSQALQVCQHHHQVVRVGDFVGLSETQRNVLCWGLGVVSLLVSSNKTDLSKKYDHIDRDSLKRSKNTTRATSSTNALSPQHSPPRPTTSKARKRRHALKC